MFFGSNENFRICIRDLPIVRNSPRYLDRKIYFAYYPSKTWQMLRYNILIIFHVRLYYFFFFFSLLWQELWSQRFRVWHYSNTARNPSDDMKSSMKIKKNPSNCIMQNKKKFESMIYSRKNNLLSLSVTTISWGYNLTKFYLGSHYILSYISTYYLTQPIPSTPARRKKTWRSIYNSFFISF